MKFPDGGPRWIQLLRDLLSGPLWEAQAPTVWPGTQWTMLSGICPPDPRLT